MNAIINVTELSSVLAERDLHKNYKDKFEGGVEGMYQTETNGDITLVEKAQDIFCDLQDHYEDLIMNCKTSKQ